MFENEYQNISSGEDTDGFVSIVGAGPGDPELLTVKALNRIKKADIILYDALHGDEILKEANQQAELIYAGKLYCDGQRQAERQESIHKQIKQFILEGKRVVRLKAGDPFIFGRGAEELSYCLREGLKVEIIPGITAGLAAATCFHIPMTLRNKNSMALFYTGHKSKGGFNEIEVVASVLKTNAPVIVYMGLKNLVLLSKELQELKINPQTPVQIASSVGHKNQQLFTTNLAEVESFLNENDPAMPSVIIIGSYAGQIDKNTKL